MSRLVIELTLKSEPNHPIKIVRSSNPGRPLRLVGALGGPFARKLWQVGRERTYLTGVATSTNFSNGLIAEYGRAGVANRRLEQVIAEYTTVEFAMTTDRLVGARLKVSDCLDGTLLFQGDIAEDAVLLY